MLFPRRRWAVLVLQAAGVPIPSREARLLIDLLLKASKKNPKELPIAEQVLFAALRMFHDKAAVAKVAEELNISPADAERTLVKLPKAAMTLAYGRGMRQFIEVANHIHFE